MFDHVVGDHPGVGVLAATRRLAYDESNNLILVKVLSLRIRGGEKQQT
jgi:hypothetical protein